MLFRKTRLNRALKKVHKADYDDWYDAGQDYEAVLKLYAAAPEEAKPEILEDFKVLGLALDMDD